MALSLALYAATEQIDCFVPSAGGKRSLSFIAAPLPGHDITVRYRDAEFIAKFLPSKSIGSATLNINVRLFENSAGEWQSFAFFQEQNDALLAINFSIDSETFNTISRKVIDAEKSACIDINLEGHAVDFDPFDGTSAEIEIRKLGENPGVEIAGWRITFLTRNQDS